MGVSFDKIDGVIWYDGRLVPWADANVHILTHGLHYASCVFEGERAYGGKVCSASGNFEISGGAAGPVAMGLRKKLVDIQYGRAEDPHDWIKKVL